MSKLQVRWLDRANIQSAGNGAAASKARRGHKKAIIAICRMLLDRYWHVLSKLKPYSAAGCLEDKVTEHSVVITKFQRLALLHKRGYIFIDEVSPAPT